MLKAELKQLKKYFIKHKFGELTISDAIPSIAKSIGVSRATIYRWIKGTQKPHNRRKQAIRESLKNMQVGLDKQK